MTPLTAPDLETLHAYVDNALAATERAAFQARLDTDAALAAALETEQNFRATLRLRVRQMRAPTSLQAQVRATLATTPSPSWWQRWLVWWSTPQPIRPYAGLAYTLLLLILVSSLFWWTGRPSRETDGALNELFDKHEMYFENQPALDVTGAGPTITAWFAQRVAFPVHTPRLSDGWELRGARLDEFQQQPAAHLLYIRGNGQRTSLSFFTPTAADFPANAHIRFASQDFFVRDNGIHRIVLWRSGAVGYALMGDLAIPAEDFLRLAVEARTQLP